MSPLKLIGACATVFCGCSFAMAPQDLARVQDIEVMSLMAYEASDAATPVAAYSRASFCAAEGILREADAGRLVDASIQCERPRQ